MAVISNAPKTAAQERTELAFENRWKTLKSNPQIIVIALFASFGGFEYGYQQGVLGQSFVMTRFIDNFPTVVESSSAKGWLTSVLQLGGILGSVTAGIFGEVFSRKYTMFSACLWVILGSFLYTGASFHKPEMLYAGRFFTGIGVGTFSGVGPLYNAELSAPELRGFIVSFYQFAPFSASCSRFGSAMVATTLEESAKVRPILRGASLRTSREFQLSSWLSVSGGFLSLLAGSLSKAATKRLSRLSRTFATYPRAMSLFRRS